MEIFLLMLTIFFVVVVVVAFLSYDDVVMELL